MFNPQDHQKKKKQAKAKQKPQGHENYMCQISSGHCGSLNSAANDTHKGVIPELLRSPESGGLRLLEVRGVFGGELMAVDPLL